MTELLIAYIVGYVYFFRKTAGYFYNEVFSGDFGDGRIDWGDATPSLCLAFFVNILYPVIVPCRLAYRLGKRYGPENFSMSKVLMPEPKPIETRADVEKKMRAFAEKELR